MRMTWNRASLGADGLLLAAAVIWGFAFAAQRDVMTVMGPFAYSAARYLLGILCLLPLLAWSRRRAPRPQALPFPARAAWYLLVGATLFLAANFQQVGLVHTTAGNAGFVTALYVVLVPLLGACLGHRPGWRIWTGALVAVAGLFVLCVQTGLRFAPGDLLELVGALFWAVWVLLVAHLAPRVESLELVVGQSTVCALLSLAAALVREPAPFAGLGSAKLALLVGGPFSIGVAYTLAAIGQRKAHPAHAAIIMSMEALFGALGGVLFLGEPASLRLVLGGGLMLGGLVLSQAPARTA
jgi:drug/metabolite transporter (DMT)-like permease